MQIDTLNEYQLMAKSTAIYPGAGTGSVIALAYLGLGLGEAGEVQGKLKKVLRDDEQRLTESARDAVADELGDVLWYVSNLAEELGLPLSEIASRNISKLLDRKSRNRIKGSGDKR